VTRSFSALTTCNASGYQRYGRRMIASFDAHWPSDVPLYVYAEGFTPDVGPRIVARDLLACSPGLVAFKQRHANNPAAHGRESRKRWRVRVKWRKLKLRVRRVDWGFGHDWDAVRFSHKSFSLFHAAKHSTSDVLFWIDADTFVFADVPRAFLESLMPADCLVSYLARPSVVTETGFVAYNLRHPAIRSFFADYEALYTRDSLFALRGTNDCFAFDAIRRRYERRGCRTHDIARGAGRDGGHVFVNSDLARFMDHLKGARKEAGASHLHDLLEERDEAYWRALRQRG
jgi:hypothetical protein